MSNETAMASEVTAAPAFSVVTETDRDRELRELRARRAELLEAAEAKGGDLELQRERRAVVDAEALNALIDQHGPLDREIATIDTDFGMVVMKRVSSGRFKKFMDRAEFKSEQLEAFVRPNCIHPLRSEFDEWCEQQPAILLRCSDALARMAGMRKADVEKK